VVLVLNVYNFCRITPKSEYFIANRCFYFLVVFYLFLLKVLKLKKTILCVFKIDDSVLKPNVNLLNLANIETQICLINYIEYNVKL